ncbi:hypothetical protein BH09BAC1_BH09BAC1_03490 [soil metagenome]
MSLPGLPLTPDPEKDAKQRRTDIQEEITGIHPNPVEKKEQHKPHPNDPTTGEEKQTPKI